MRSKIIYVLSFLVIFFSQFTHAQDRVISGVVADQMGPLPGANVVVKGTTTGVQTDFDGKFSIKAKTGDVLVVSFTGYATQNITVGAASTYNIKLAEGVVLTEVVVEAYRTTTKPKSNVAIASVSSKTIEARPNATFMQTLQGQVAGLNIQTGTGQPGAGSTVIIRGANSLNGQIEPLYIIDGVPQNGDNFRSINPNEIANVSVLKDAGATAIYGNRGSNGAIIVTTKRGSFEQDLAVEYIGTSGFSEFQGNRYNLLDSRRLLNLERQLGRGLGAAAGVTPEEIAQYSNVNTDWRDVFFRTGVTQSHTLNFSAGSKNLASFISLGYMEQQGILLNSDLQRFNFRSNTNGKSSNGKFTYGANVSVNFSKRNSPGSIGTGGVNQNLVLGANASLPYISPSMYSSSRQVFIDYEEDRIFDQDPLDSSFGPLAQTLAYTPLFLIDKSKTFVNRIDELKALANLTATYNFTKELSFTPTVALDFTQSRQLTYEDPDSFNAYVFLGDGQEFGGFEAYANTRSFFANINSQLKYVKTFKEKHTLEVSAITEYFKGHGVTDGFTQNGLDPKTSFPGSGVGYIAFQNDNAFYVPDVSASASESGLFSYFLYADYDFNSRFGFSGTIRRDSSFRFSDENRWGTFWSLSGRWNIDQEKFMQNSVFNALKLRASIGTNGNQDLLGSGFFGGSQIPRDLYQSLPSYANLPGFFPQIGNPLIKWETVKQINVGIDFELFNNRLRGAVDVYDKTTSDLFTPVNISWIVGQNSIDGNFGKFSNRGVDLNLSFDVIRNTEKQIKFTLNFNGNYNKNKILDVFPDTNQIWDGESLTINREGGMLGEFFLVPYAGVNPATGNMLFYDNDGNVTERLDPSTNRRMTGKTALPLYQGGFGFDFDYKGFFISTLFTYVKDIWRFDYDYSGLVDPDNVGQFNVSADLLDAWTPDNTVTYMPSLNVSNDDLDDFSDRFLKDASYIRLRNLNFGYNFNKKLLERSFIKGARVFVQAENLVTWSKWRGWDAESNRSADQYQYPTPRIFTLGLEIKI